MTFSPPPPSPGAIDAPFDVVGLGGCALDHVGTIGSFPEPDSKSELGELVVDGGGPVATALVALARWGHRCGFAGVIGDDETGGRIRDSLEGEGIDVGGMVVRQGCASQFAFVLAEPPTARRTILWRRPTGEPLRPDEIELGAVTRARVLHTDGLFPEAAIVAARAARQARAHVVVDAGTLRDGMLELARTAHAFIASQSFARALVGREDPRAACRQLALLGPALVCVTLGAEGYVALVNGHWIDGAAYRVDARDTTGCGDVFHAGYVHGFLQGLPPAASLDFGAFAAARVATRLGGRAGIPKVAEWPGGNVERP
jgi:ribokinase